jgi:hypothetical protein
LEDVKWIQNLKGIKTHSKAGALTKSHHLLHKELEVRLDFHHNGILAIQKHPEIRVI